MKKSLSPEFCSFIGNDNIFQDHLFSKSQFADIMRANVEMLMSMSCLKKKVGSVEQLEFIRAIPGYLFGYKERHGSWEVYRNFPVSGDPRLYMFEWKVTDTKKGSPLHGTTRERGHGFVSLCSTLNGCSELVALKKITDINSLGLDSVFDFNSGQDGVWIRCGESIDYTFLPPAIKVGTENFFKKGEYLLQDSSFVKGAFVLYESEMMSEFLLPCCLAIRSFDHPVPCNILGNDLPPRYFERKKGLAVGEEAYFILGQRGRSYLLNMHLLNESREYDFILLFESPILAIKIEKLVEKFDTCVRDRFLVTSWYGGYRSIEGADFSYLYRKNIIFIPEISAISYNKVGGCYDKCIAAMVAKFSVLIRPITLKKIPKLGDLAKMSIFEQSLARTAVNISDLDQSLFISLISKAIPFEKYLEIIKHPEISSPKSICSLRAVDFPSSIDDICEARSELCNLSLDSIVQSKKITIVIGPNNSGKSIFILSILRAISDGEVVFNLGPNNKRNVLLIDGETDKDILHERNCRVKSAFQSINTNYRPGYFCVEGMGYGHNFNFSEEFSRKVVENWLSTGKFNVVAFDNLNSLVPGHVQATGKISDFFIWLRSLEDKYGIAIILAHHTKDEKNEVKRSSGSKEIDEKCQTVIAITGREELERLQDDEVKLITSRFKSSKGALFQFYVKKCKHVHGFEGKTVCCHLPLNIDSPTKGSGWICFHNTSNDEFTSFHHEHGVGSGPRVFPDYSRLTTDERRVMIELAHEFKSFPRKKVDNLLKCSSEKSRNILKSLKDKHRLLIVLEDGKGTKRTMYSLHNDDVK